MVGMLTAFLNRAFWLPEQASTFASDIDGLFMFVYYLCIFFFIIIVGAMGYFAWKYRYQGEADVKTSPIRGNHKLEIFWSAVPGAILVVIFAWGFTGFMNASVPPGDALDVRIEGQKWSWTMTYENGGSDSNTLVVPVNQPVKLTMSSIDVLHSFYIPAFRIKRDVLPNRYTVLWFEATEVGEYRIFCTEYCGDRHSSMLGTVKVVEEEEYLAYIDSLGGCAEGETLADCGAREYVRQGCNACHSVDGSRVVGPSWLGIWNTERPMNDGTTELADENYMRESIMNPNAEIVEGYNANQMPTYAGRLEEEQLTAIIAYIQSLGE